MVEWVMKISGAAILFTVVSYILPKSNIRNASMLALSFVFLSVLIIPLTDLTTEFISRKIALDSEKNELLNQVQDSNAQQQVMEHYKNRLKEEIIKSLAEKKYVCKEVVITVDENLSSESFGSVLSVVCTVSEKSEEKKEDSLKKIKVPNIVIDKHGIRIEKKESTENKDMKIYEKDIKDIIFELTGADENRVIIRWGE